MKFSLSLFAKRVLSFVSIFLAPWVYATEHLAPEFAVDVSLRYQAQQFSERSASLWSATISPYLVYDSFIFGVDLPYQQVSGVFNFRGTTQQERNCALLSEGAALPDKLEQYRDRLVARCATLTQDNNTEEGMGDLNVYGSYGLGVGDDSRYLIWTLGYSGDNADEQRQLGSGTRDMYTDIVLTQDEEHYSMLFLAGYNYLLGGVYEDLYESYGYVGAELSSPRVKPWVFGVGLDYQDDSVEAIASARLFGQWRVMDSLAVKIQWKAYESSSYYPNSAVDASMQLSF